ncbi:transposase DNA-binding-containing protein [Jiella pelagia]
MDLLRRPRNRMGATTPLARQDWANTKAAYRFFTNPNVDEGQFLIGHFEATKARYASRAKAPFSRFRKPQFHLPSQEAADKLGRSSISSPQPARS